MALSRDEILDLIEDEFGGLDESTKLSVANDFNDANNYERFYPNTWDSIIDFCNDSITTYLEWKRHSDEYDPDDDYFRISGYGWWHSFDSIEDEVDARALAEYVYDHWDDYDTTFDMTANEIQIALDEDELAEDEEEETEEEEE